MFKELVTIIALLSSTNLSLSAMGTLAPEAGQAEDANQEKQCLTTHLLKAGLCGLTLTKVTLPMLSVVLRTFVNYYEKIDSCIKYNIIPNVLSLTLDKTLDNAVFDLTLVGTHNTSNNCHIIGSVDYKALLFSAVLGALCIKLGYETVKNLIKAARQSIKISKNKLLKKSNLKHSYNS